MRERPSSPTVAVRRALSTLRTARSTSDLFDRATRALCDHCGFDRAVAFRLSGYEMLPASVHFADDPAWGREFQRLGEEQPMRVDYDIVETEMISTRAPMLVPNAQDNPRGFRPLVEASRTRSYVAAPVVPENVVIGFVHADAYFQDRDVDEADRDILGIFAEGYGFALERTLLAEGVRRQRSHIHKVRDIVNEAAEKVSDAVTGIERATLSEDSPDAPVLRVPGYEITRREADILRLLGEGESEAQVADRLGVPPTSVTWHVNRTLGKLRATTQEEAISRYRSLAGDELAGAARGR